MNDDTIDNILQEYIPTCADKITDYYSEKSQYMEAPSEQFLRNMKRLIRKAKWKEKYHIPVRTGQRIAAAILMFIITTTMLTVSVDAIREKVIQWFTVVCDDYVMYQYQTDDTHEKFVPLYPTYLPENYEKTEETLQDDMLIVTYKNTTTGDVLIVGEMWIVDQDRIYENSEFDSVKDTSIHGREATVGYKEEGMTVSWREAGCRIIVDSSNLSNEEELIRVCESLRKSN